MNNFTIDMAEKSENLNSNSILRLYKQNIMLKFMAIKSNEPKLTQKQICKQLRNSDSTIKRYRDDIDMDSPYKRNNYKKKQLNKTQILLLLPLRIHRRMKIRNLLQTRKLKIISQKVVIPTLNKLFRMIKQTLF